MTSLSDTTWIIRSAPYKGASRRHLTHQSQWRYLCTITAPSAESALDLADARRQLTGVRPGETAVATSLRSWEVEWEARRTRARRLHRFHLPATATAETAPV